MKYKEIVKIIKNISLALPDVESFYTGDVYEINADQSVKYGSVVLTNQEHSFDNVNDQFNYNFVLFYIDRLTDDEANRIDVQTAGINALTTIVKSIEDYGCIIDNVRYNVFRERFNDWCSGVYGTFSIQVDDNDCVEEFEIITPEKLKSITINSNGTYKGLFNEVNVQVPIPEPNLQTKSISITENGTYSVEKSDNVDGMSAVAINVNVPIPKIKLKSGRNIILSGDVNANVFDVSEMTYMAYLFGTSSGMTSFIANEWDTSKVTNMQNMFGDCTNLSTIDVSGWNTSSLTNTHSMFCYIKALKNLDLSTWNVSSLKDASDMFQGCTGMTSLNLSGWNLSNLEYIGQMFGECYSLVELKLDGTILPQINLNWGISYCKNINMDSLDGILNALPRNDTGSSLTCYLGDDNIARLNEEQKIRAVNKGWTLN